MDWCLLMLVSDAIVIAFIFAINGMHFDHTNVDVKLNVQCKRPWDLM